MNSQKLGEEYNMPPPQLITIAQSTVIWAISEDDILVHVHKTLIKMLLVGEFHLATLTTTARPSSAQMCTHIFLVSVTIIYHIVHHFCLVDLV